MAWTLALAQAREGELAPGSGLVASRPEQQGWTERFTPGKEETKMVTGKKLVSEEFVLWRAQDLSWGDVTRDPLPVFKEGSGLTAAPGLDPRGPSCPVGSRAVLIVCTEKCPRHSQGPRNLLEWKPVSSLLS